jgi:hypothetical protein
MTMARLRLLLFAVLFGTLTLGPALGASKKKPEAPLIQGPIIASVTATSITISEGKTAKTLIITQFTEITVNGIKASAAELKPGMNVSITLGTDSSKASRINATGK